MRAFLHEAFVLTGTRQDQSGTIDAQEMQQFLAERPFEQNMERTFFVSIL
jgi:hypothetical protein